MPLNPNTSPPSIPPLKTSLHSSGLGRCFDPLNSRLQALPLVSVVLCLRARRAAVDGVGVPRVFVQNHLTKSRKQINQNSINSTKCGGEEQLQLPRWSQVPQRNSLLYNYDPHLKSLCASPIFIECAHCVCAPSVPPLPPCLK